MRPSEILALKADEIREIIARYPVRNPRIFGSAARGDDAEGSDLDLLVELRGTDRRGLVSTRREDTNWIEGLLQAPERVGVFLRVACTILH